jgi:hypothetical protein
MKKLLLGFTLGLILLTGTASAEKFRYKDPDFDFKNYRTAALTDIAIRVANVPDFVADQGSDQKIRLQLQEALSKKKIRLRLENQPLPAPDTGAAQSAATTTTTGPSWRSALTPAGSAKNIPQIQVKVYRLGYEKFYHGPWTETKNYTRTVTVKNHDGKEETIYIPETTIVDHPEGYDLQAWAELEFNVTDTRTGKSIYTLRDSRYRAGADYDGMLKRICNEFVEDITKA